MSKYTLVIYSPTIAKGVVKDNKKNEYFLLDVLDGKEKLNKAKISLTIYDAVVQSDYRFCNLNSNDLEVFTDFMRHE